MRQCATARILRCVSLRAVAFAEAKSSDRNRMRSYLALCRTDQHHPDHWPTTASRGKRRYYRNSPVQHTVGVTHPAWTDQGSTMEH